MLRLKICALLICIYFLLTLYKIYRTKDKKYLVIEILLIVVLIFFSLAPFIFVIGDSQLILIVNLFMAIFIPLKILNYKFLPKGIKVICYISIFLLFMSNYLPAEGINGVNSRFWFFNNFTEMENTLSERFLFPKYLPDNLSVEYNERDSYFQGVYACPATINIPPKKTNKNINGFFFELSSFNKENTVDSKIHFKMHGDNIESIKPKIESFEEFVDVNGLKYYIELEPYVERKENGLFTIATSLYVKHKEKYYSIYYKHYDVDEEQLEYYKNLTKEEIIKIYNSLF